MEVKQEDIFKYLPLAKKYCKTEIVKLATRSEKSYSLNLSDNLFEYWRKYHIRQLKLPATFRLKFIYFSKEKEPQGMMAIYSNEFVIKEKTEKILFLSSKKEKNGK